MICRLLALATCLCSTLPFAAHAQSAGDRYWLEIALYRPDVDTDVSVSSTERNTIGTDIDLERDLNLKKEKSLPSVLLGWRVSSDLVLFAEYYALNRSGVTSLARDITFDDVTYPVSASVTSNMDTDVYRLSLGWSFINKPNFEAGAALGIHATNFDVSMTGEASAGGSGVSTEVRRRDFLAPLPTVGLYANWQVATALTLGARLDYLSLKISDYDGRLINSRVSLLYRFSQHVGVGAAWRHVDYRVDVTKPAWEGRVSYEFTGPSLFLQAGF